MNLLTYQPTQTQGLRQYNKQWKTLQYCKAQLIEEAAALDFYVFYHFIFAKSLAIIEGTYVPAKFMQDWCAQMQDNQQTAREGARNHQKSTILQAWVCWNVYRLRSFQPMLFEGAWICYKSDLAEYHLRRVNLYIQVNPHFEHVNKLTDAETFVEYGTNGKGNDQKLIKYTPEGMLSFKRGKHYNDVIVDDPLRDPSNALDISQIQKITDVFNDQVQSLPKPGGSLHVSGTRQDKHDLFWHLLANEQFTFFSCPAEVDPVKQIALWPERFPWAALKAIEVSIGKRSYEKEYLCKPVRNLESFFTETELAPIIKTELKNHAYDEPRETQHEIYAGFDIGKKRHPSHLSVFEKQQLPGEDGEAQFKLVQILTLWLDGWDYYRQVELLQVAVECLQIDLVLYDNTRGEFESLNETGELPAALEPFIFSAKSKRAIATGFEKAARQGKLELIDDARQTRQILNCDNNLNSAETAEGHGDTFWSNALAIAAATRPVPGIRMI